jgi:peptide/nickel transport system permease protein
VRFLLWLGRTAAVVIPVFFIATFITFLLGAASGLDPAASIAGDSATPAVIAQLRHEFGLDLPLWQRYLDFMGGILTGDLGVSWYSTGVSVDSLLWQRIGISASVGVLALVIGLVLGPVLGVLAATHRGRFVDRFVTTLTSIVSTLPPFVLSIGLILLLAVGLRWLPSGGYVPPAEDPWMWFRLILMPGIALSVELVAGLARQLRTGLVGALDDNYVTGAIVRGFSPRRVLWGHAMRNAAGPALATLSLYVPTLIGGAVMTETIFNMQGFSQLISDSALRQDVPIVLGALVVSIAVVLVSTIVLNGLQGLLQPASRRERTS